MGLHVVMKPRSRWGRDVANQRRARTLRRIALVASSIRMDWQQRCALPRLCAAATYLLAAQAQRGVYACACFHLVAAGPNDSKCLLERGCVERWEAVCGDALVGSTYEAAAGSRTSTWHGCASVLQSRGQDEPEAAAASARTAFKPSSGGPCHSVQSTARHALHAVFAPYSTPGRRRSIALARIKLCTAQRARRAPRGCTASYGDAGRASS